MVAFLEDLGVSSNMVACNYLERHSRDLMASYDLKETRHTVGAQAYMQAKHQNTYKNK